MKSKQTNTLWGAAFSQKPSEAVIAFTAGRDVAAVSPADAKLLPYDLWVNKAHCIMLAKTGIIPKSDAGKIFAGLIKLEKLAKAGKFPLDPAKEDVHTNIESWLTDKLGIEIAGKLHTARSRNDQTNTDTRLFLRDQVVQFVENTSTLVHELLIQAKAHTGTVMPGFTHHQHAMVTTWGHVLAAFATMLLRDTARFTHWYTLHNYSPLGNSVAYGTTFPIDKAFTAKMLGFDGPEVNSLDEITNRWEAEADLGFDVAILMNHLSLIAETLILFATPEFGMVKLADQFSTGSSIMPQKKNPDPLEVIKGKASYTAGILSGLLSMGKSNFIGFNRDSQWTKYLIMDLVEECLPAPIVMKGVIETLTVNNTVMTSWCDKGFIGATTLMEQLINEFHLPMRQAKVIIEKAVKASTGQEKVSFPALQQALADEGEGLPVTEAQVVNWQNPAIIISLTKSFGGPGKQSMKTSLKKLHKKLQKQKSWLLQKQKEKASAEALLIEEGHV
jgi:argininosuccinate lyase